MLRQFEILALMEKVDVDRWFGFVPEAYRGWVIPGILLLVGLLVFQAIWKALARAVRRRRPPAIHPRLQKYNVDHAELDRQRREKAREIVATSTGNRLAGYRVVRQIDAVFVDGYRTPEDAVIALKAAAAEKGANAILNVHTDRVSAGRCTASGDAILVAAVMAPPKRTPPSGSKPHRLPPDSD